MIYLNILDGSQAGNYIEIAPNTKLSMASSFGSDIYLLLPSWDNFECNFTLKDNKITFHDNSHEFLVNSEPVEINKAYETPILCTIEGINVAFSNDPYTQLEHFTQAPPLFDGDEPVAELLAEDLEDLGITPFEEVKQPSLFEKYIGSYLDKFIDSKFMRLVFNVLDKAQNSKVYLLGKKLLGMLLALGKSQTKRLYQKIGYWIYGILAALILITVIISGSLYQIHQSEQAELVIHNRQLTKSLLDQQLFKLSNRYSNLRISGKDSDNYQINGVVDNEKDIQYLHKVFNAVYPKLKYNLILVDTIKPQLLTILQQHKIMKPQIEFESSSGTLAIRGIASSMDIIDDAEIAISNQYPELGKLDTSNMFLASDLDNGLDTMLAADKYKQHLDITKNYDEGTIKISGYLSSTDILELKAQVMKFNLKYSNAVHVILEVQDLIKALPFGISEVYTGTPAWIITNDGQRIYQGGSYKGISVTSIDNEKIVFRGKFTLTLMLNQLIPSKMEGGIPSDHSLNSIANEQNVMVNKEKQSEQEIIAKEQSQLNSLRLIIQKTDDKGLKDSLNETIKNLEDDLKYRQADYQYYFKESADNGNSNRQ